MIQGRASPLGEKLGVFVVRREREASVPRIMAMESAGFSPGEKPLKDRKPDFTNQPSDLIVE